MRNYIQPGHAITLAAPYDVVSGAGLLVGSIFGVASHDALSGAEVETQLTGVIDLAKVASQAWTAGAKVYWDNSAKRVTNVASGNTLDRRGGARRRRRRRRDRRAGAAQRQLLSR